MAKAENDPLVGRTVIEVRPMNMAEIEREGWEHHRGQIPTALVFDDGSVIYPSRDEEGNGPGALFGTDSQKRTIIIRGQ